MPSGRAGLGLRHLLVASCRCDRARARGSPRFLGPGRVGRERACDQLVVAVDAAAMRCTAPMKAPCRRRPCRAGCALLRSLLLPSMPCRSLLPVRRAQMPILRVAPLVGRAAGEIVEGALGDANDVVVDEGRAFRGPVLRMLEAAFPFEHGPAVVVVAAASLEKMPAKSTWPSPSERKRPARLTQRLVAAIDALAAGRIELRILDVEHLDALVVDVDVLADSRAAAARSGAGRRGCWRAGGSSTRSRNISKVTPSWRSSPGWIS